MVTKKNNGSIFANLYYGDTYETDSRQNYEMAGSVNKVTYTVTKGNGRKAKALPESTEVCISTTDAELINAFNMNAELYGDLDITRVADGQYRTNLDETGSFAVDYADANGNFSITKGKHSFTVTPVDDEGNATAKGAAVTVKAIKAPKAKVEMKTTKFNNFGSVQPIAFKNRSNIMVWFDGASYASSLSFTEDLYGDNVSGRITNFKDAFRIGYDDTANVRTLECIGETPV